MLIHRILTNKQPMYNVEDEYFSFNHIGDFQSLFQ